MSKYLAFDLFVIIILKGCFADPQKFKDVIVEAFPKLRQGGEFELLKISGNTRSRYLSLIPCPNEGYHVKYLKDPQNQIGHATIFISPLQRNLEVESVSYILSNRECFNIYIKHV